MKEATGELNSTVIVILSVGVLSTFFFGYLWPLIHHNFQREANCKSATCNCCKEENGKTCKDGVGRVNRNGVEYCTCTIEGDDQPIECVYKG